MTTPEPDTRYRQPIRLRDGRPALIRALRADDLGRLELAFAQLDRETIYRRFFCHRRGLDDADRAAIADNDFVRRAQLLVTIGEGDDEVVIGSGLYVVELHADPPSAEVAPTAAPPMAAAMPILAPSDRPLAMAAEGAPPGTPLGLGAGTGAGFGVGSGLLSSRFRRATWMSWDWRSRLG